MAAAPRLGRRVPRPWRTVIVACACLAGAVTVAAATRRGVGLSPDSLQYVAASQQGDSGVLRTVGWDGVPTRLTHFPPGYPIALAASRGSGSSPETFARWLNVALFAALIGLTARLTRDVAPVSAWGAAAAAAWLCALAPDLVAAHSMVWSEPLYLTLTALGLLALSAALARGSGPWLALAGG
ncbi:MAG: hypothetical protein ACT4R6_14235, partial [Gemmatimonadaceae bacterium]